MENLKSSFLAGIAISIGCIAFIKTGGIIGAILFTFGLLTVVHYKLKLFTGTAGFFKNKKEFKDLWTILIGNILGCLFVSLCIRLSCPDIVEGSGKILCNRLSLPWIGYLVLGGGCGFIMTTAVNFGRDGKFLPLLFGVPIFIMCGFLHSIADAFYYVTSPIDIICDNVAKIIPMYLFIVIGNFLGCNLYRIIFYKTNK